MQTLWAPTRNAAQEELLGCQHAEVSELPGHPRAKLKDRLPNAKLKDRRHRLLPIHQAVGQSPAENLDRGQEESLAYGGRAFQVVAHASAGR